MTEEKQIGQNVAQCWNGWKERLTQFMNKGMRAKFKWISFREIDGESKRVCGSHSFIIYYNFECQ